MVNSSQFTSCAKLHLAYRDNRIGRMKDLTEGMENRQDCRIGRMKDLTDGMESRQDCRIGRMKDECGDF